MFPSNRQALAAFGPTGVDDLLTIARSHAGTKAVRPLALEHAGLECALHGVAARPERERDSKEGNRGCQFTN